MAALPTDAFAATDNLQIDLSLTDGTNDYIVSKTYNIGTDLAFLKDGIAQGKSYYFQLKVDAADLAAVTKKTYAVGDYYPTPDDATTAEGVVFWLKGDSFGTEGKIVSLDEGRGVWGIYIDESVDVIGIRRTDNGAEGTKNLIITRNDTNFARHYYAFHWIYKTKNNEDINGKWYMPAIEELQALYDGYTSFGDFNNKLTEAGGDALGSLSYWSSSEVALYDEWGIDTYAVWRVRFSDGYSSLGDKTYDNYVRAVREF